MSGILIQAEALLGPAVRIHPHRGWAEFWCPFHPDAARQGRRGRPNFGVSLVDGRWKCLRCGRSGPSLAALARELGKEIPDRRAEASQSPENGSRLCKVVKWRFVARIPHHGSQSPENGSRLCKLAVLNADERPNGKRVAIP